MSTTAETANPEASVPAVGVACFGGRTCPTGARGGEAGTEWLPLLRARGRKCWPLGATAYRDCLQPSLSSLSRLVLPAPPFLPQAELALGLSLLGPIDEKFVTVSEVAVPTNDSSKVGGVRSREGRALVCWRPPALRLGRGLWGIASSPSRSAAALFAQPAFLPRFLFSQDRCFITAGYDPTTHFQTTMEDVLALYTKASEAAAIDTVNIIQIGPFPPPIPFPFSRL